MQGDVNAVLRGLVATEILAELLAVETTLDAYRPNAKQFGPVLPSTHENHAAK